MKEVVFTFARMNPPTLGHEKMLVCLGNLAIERQADHVVFLSHSFDISENPLQWDEKATLFGEVFPGVNLSRNQDIKNPFQAIELLSKQYSRVTAVVGDDRAESFRKSFTQYEHTWGIKFEVVSAGARKGKDTAAKASGTLLRQAAANRDFKTFMKFSPTRLDPSLGRYVFNLLGNRVLY